MANDANEYVGSVRQANDYIVAKDAEWIQRWEERESKFRDEISKLRNYYQEREKATNLRLAQLDKTLHDQQEVILTIREIPWLGPKILKWSGYDQS